MFRADFSVSAKGNNGRLKRRPYEFCLSFFVCAALQLTPYSLEKTDSLSFCRKPRLEKQLL